MVNLREKGTLVESLWHCVNDSCGNLANVPGAVRAVLLTGAWKERVYRGKTYAHGTFLDFITAKPLAGCGWPPAKVEALIKDDPEVLAMWREATTGEKHKHKANGDADNISITPRHGTSRAYTLSRLKHKNPTLY